MCPFNGGRRGHQGGTAGVTSEEMISQDHDLVEEEGRQAASDGSGTARAAEAEAAPGGPEPGDAGDAGDGDEAGSDSDSGPSTKSTPQADGAPDPVPELEAERDRLKDRHLRLAADFDNYRKRTEERLRQGWDRAQADLVARLLDPLDDLLRVTALEPENKSSVDSIVEGVDLVERKFFQVLKDAGVEVVDPAGEVFDPNTMEAMMRVPTESDDDDDTVAMVFQKGYTLKGQLIRPARVSVFKCQ